MEGLDSTRNADSTNRVVLGSTRLVGLATNFI